MAKIGIDIRPIGKKRTGDEVYFFGLVKNLALQDKENEYSLYTDRDPEIDVDLNEEIKKLSLGENFKVIFVKKTNRFCWNFWYLPMFLRKNPVDIFHTQYIAPFWISKKVKLILTIHDISFNFFPEYIKKIDLFFLKTLIPRSIQRANKIVTVSESEKKNIIDFYKIPEEKVDYAYNGVDSERFSQRYSEEEKKKICAKYDLPRKFILYIGTLQPRKNIPILIEALKNLDVKLVLAGNRKAHNFDQKIDRTIEKHNLNDKVVFPGWIDEEDKVALLQSADCFVFPSVYEGFGIPVVEAMAAGIPVVCSEIPVLREIAQGAAFFCDPKNSGDFTKNIRKVLTDENLRRNLVEKGKNITQELTWKKTAKKTLDIYKSLI
jgi:glycosyltransferase involved in cell wall biosynthesis